MSNYLVTDTELTSVADAIRTKGGTSADLEFPDGFVTAIGNISGGGGNLGTKTISSNGTYEAEDDGYDGYSEVTVSVPTGTARTSSDLTASGATVTAPAGLYASAASKSVASGSATTPATTITANPSISVGSDGLITATASATQSVTPTVSAGYVSSGTAGTITVSGSNTSQLTVKDSDDLTFASRVFTAPAGYYPEAATKTIAEGTFTTQVGDPDSTGLIAYSTYTSSGWYAVATLSGTKQLSTQAAQTIHPSTSDQTVASGKWLTGAQTIKAVTMTNLDAGNIKKDVVVKIGDSTDDDCVTSVTGTYEGGGTDYMAANLNGTLTSYESDAVTSLRANAIRSYSALTSFKCHNVVTINGLAFYNTGISVLAFPELKNLNAQGLSNVGSSLTTLDLGTPLTGLGNQAINNNANLDTIILRKTTIVPMTNVNCIAGTKFKSGGTGGTIYIPKALYDHLGDGGTSDYRAATGWSTVWGYGTITWAKIEGSIYETQYADGTTIPT